MTLMINKSEDKESYNPIADRVEKRTNEISKKSERIVNDSLDILKDLIFKLLEVRPREYKPREYTQREFRLKERGDEE